MATRWRRLYVHMWVDERFRRLTPAQQLVAVYLLTSSATNRIGLYHLSLAMAAEQTGLPMSDPPAGNGMGYPADTVPAGYSGGTGRVSGPVPETFPEAFAAVCRAFGWRWDEAARVLFIPSWFRYNPADNPKAMQGFLSDLDELPKTRLLEEFLANTQHLTEPVAAELKAWAPPPRIGGTRYTPDTVSAGSRVGMPYQEQEQEQDRNPPPTPPRNGEGGSSDGGPKSKQKRPARRKGSPDDHPHFETFWTAYPRKVDKTKAARAFVDLAPDDQLFAVIMAALDRHKRSAKWLKDDGEYIPYPATWLNGRRWEDELPSGPPAGAAPRPPPTMAELKANGLI